MSRRRRPLLVLATLALPLVVLLLAPAATAATVGDTGWWQRDVAPIGAAAPPPAGALRVAHDATGPSAVAGIRFTVGAQERAPVLTLRVLGSTVPGGAGFIACPTAGGWEAASGGAWADRPDAPCDAVTITGSVSEDGSRVVFALSPLVSGGKVDVAITPTAPGGDPVTGTFTVDFATPVDSDIQTTPRATTTTAAPTTAAPSSPPPTQSNVAPPPPVTTPPTQPPADIPPVPVDDTTPTTAPVAADPVAAPPLTPEAPTSDTDDGGSDTPRRLFGFALAAGIVGVGAWLKVNDTPAATGPTMGGLGPFTKERVGDAPDVT